MCGCHRPHHSGVVRSIPAQIQAFSRNFFSVEPRDPVGKCGVRSVRLSSVRRAKNTHFKRCPKCGGRFGVRVRHCPIDNTELIDPASDRDRLVGLVIDDRYELLHAIGQGAVGTVYKARHTRIPRDLAVKVLGMHREDDSRAIARFRSEVRAEALLLHPHVVEVIDFGYFDGVGYYIVMEYLEGESLASRLSRERPLKILDTFKIVEQALDALTAAHERGIVHRDFKAENVFLVRNPHRPGDFEVRLLDFGVAKIVHRDPGMWTHYTETRPGLLVGTPSAMAPEQIRGMAIDHRVDFYGLGVLMYELLTGHQPFEGDDVRELLRMHLHADPTPPSARPQAGWIVPELDRLVLRLLAKDAAERPSTTSVIRQELERVRAPACDAWASLHMGRLRRRTKRPGVAPLEIVSGQHVLIVDDELTIRRLFQQLMARNGFAASAVESGEQALAWLRDNPKPFAVVLDVMMPGTDGLEVLRRIRLLGFDGPVIVCTGLNPAVLREQLCSLDKVYVIDKLDGFQQIPKLIASELQSSATVA